MWLDVMFTWRIISTVDWVLSKPLSTKLSEFYNMSGIVTDSLGENKINEWLYSLVWSNFCLKNTFSKSISDFMHSDFCLQIHSHIKFGFALSLLILSPIKLLAETLSNCSSVLDIPSVVYIMTCLFFHLLESNLKISNFYFC